MVFQQLNFLGDLVAPLVVGFVGGFLLWTSEHWIYGMALIGMSFFGLLSGIVGKIK